MQAYCKHCRQTHAVWNRLNDSVICGRCGTRVRVSELLTRAPAATVASGHRDRPTQPRGHKPA
jgi:hypothetical protein